MTEDRATAIPSAEEKDSAITPVIEQNPNGHSEADTGTEEGTSIQNEESLEDPTGTPEGDAEEELDPLLKAKKHADRKIAELGERASTSDKMLTVAVSKNPELLIEMYDPKSELFNRKLAERISAENPDAYARADAIFRQRQERAPAPQAYAPQGVVTDAMFEQKMAEYLAKHEKVVTEKSATQEFQESLGYTDEQFQVISQNLKTVAASIREADSSVDLKTSLKRAFIAMFPGDFENEVRQKTMLDVAKKKAMTSPSGGGEGAPVERRKMKLSADQEAGQKASGLPLDRYLELQEKYPHLKK